MQKSVVSWSGGKDAALALHRLQQSGKRPPLLLTTVNGAEQTVTAHRINTLLVQAQAAAMGLALQQVDVSSNGYDAAMSKAWKTLSDSGFKNAVFGDIFLEDLKQYREAQLQPHGINAVFPLWTCNSKMLMQEFLSAGFKAIVVCVNGSVLPPHFCGRLIDEQFIADLPPTVDVCGENGEYHSFVFDGPLFTQPVKFRKGNTVKSLQPAPKSIDESDEKPKPDIPFFYNQLLPL